MIRRFPYVFNAPGGVLLAIALLSACGGSRSGLQTLAVASGNTERSADQSGSSISTVNLAQAKAGGISIDAGGGAVSPFVADRDFVPQGSWEDVTTHAIDTSRVTHPAPQAVYQHERDGQTVSYSIGGLVAHASYTVRLDFAELFWNAPNKRVFSVAINNTTVLSNFDIFAVTGGQYRALAQTFTASASQSGTIAITFIASIDNAAIDGIELSPGGVSGNTFNDYSTFGYDNARDVFNPNSTAITPAALPNLHLAWQAAVGDYNTQTQPILATEIAGHAGVLFIGGGSGKVYGYDAHTGAVMWTTPLGQESYTLCGGGTAYLGVGGTVAYDPATKSLYVVGNSNAAPNASANNSLFHLDGASGKVLGQVNFAPPANGLNELDFSHTAVTLNGGVAYVGTGSSCDISDWRGRVVAINVPAMTIANTFFTLWDPQNLRGAGPQPWAGGGVWGWGGVALDNSGNVLTGVGNADNWEPNGQIQPPFSPAPQEYSGYAETLLELSPNIGNAIANNHPIPENSYNAQSNDLDVQGTPVILQPNGAGCGMMVALQGKSGELNLYAESALDNGPAAQYQLSPSTWNDGYLGGPTYSPVTGLLYAPVASSVAPTLFAPGLIAVNPGCGQPYVSWHAAFGVDSSGTGFPRAVPAVSAGGVVFAGTVDNTSGDLWAIDATTGTVLHGGTPLLRTSGYLRMPPTIDGDWMFVIDQSGNMYGLTTDPHFAAIQPTLRAADPRSLHAWRSARPSP